MTVEQIATGAFPCFPCLAHEVLPSSNSIAFETDLCSGPVSAGRRWQHALVANQESGHGIGRHIEIMPAKGQKCIESRPVG